MVKKSMYMVMLAGLLLLAACAGRSEQLLRQNPRGMGDEELLQYFYQLDEEVAACQARSPGGTAVGVGTGFGTGGFRLGVGIQQRLATRGCDLDGLRQRRGEVRLELNKRGLSP